VATSKYLIGGRQGSERHPAAASGTLHDMTSFLLAILFLITLLAAFVMGVALAYWIIRGVLNFFDPGRIRNKPSVSPALAPSGD
jgi:hypothetical protein